MAKELPGLIPHVLRVDDVSLLRADETVFNAMVDGWRAQMLAHGLAVDTMLRSISTTSVAIELDQPLVADPEVMRDLVEHDVPDLAA
jgi:hypothetical protein